ncbi:MAG: FprA family A-type flavoprotein [Candidatus Scalinduaceae bacterium]
MNHIRIKDNIYWVGAINPDMRVFGMVFKVDHGTTYNSYLIKDKKTAIIDTVKASFTDGFISNTKSLTDPKHIDFIIISHSEPDHSGALSELLKLAVNAKVIASKSGGNLLKNIINASYDLINIEECKCIKPGTYELKFIPTRYLHWPDTFIT